MARVSSMPCLTAAAQFRFGNAPVVVGHEAIHAAAARFFSAMRPADTDRCASASPYETMLILISARRCRPAQIDNAP